EDGIRDFHVTGVQTCALPISVRGATPKPTPLPNIVVRKIAEESPQVVDFNLNVSHGTALASTWLKETIRLRSTGVEHERFNFCRCYRIGNRSEERRVGKERRS